MQIRRRLAAGLTGVMAGFFAGVLAAQRPLLTVGGANPSHTSLPVAVAAAAPGSVILVRPGFHTGFNTNKPLRVVLDFTNQTGSITAPTGAPYAIIVTGIPFDQDFAIVGRGAGIGAGTLGAIRVANTTGRVLIDGIFVNVPGTRDGLDVQNAAAVIVQNSSFTGRHALQVQDASLVSSDVSWSSVSSFGVVALRSTLDIALGRFAGHAAPALRVINSAVRLAGNGSTVIRVNGSPAGPVSAFEAIQSDVQWDINTFVLSPQNGAPAFSQVGGLLLAEDVPALVATGGPPGATVDVTMSRPAPGIGVIMLGNLTLSHTVFGVQGIYLNETLPILTLVLGTVNATGLSRQATWPNVPWLLGEVFCCQGVMLGNNGLLRTGPVVWAAM